jgi:hypothetical protein
MKIKEEKLKRQSDAEKQKNKSYSNTVDQRPQSKILKSEAQKEFLNEKVRSEMNKEEYKYNIKYFTHNASFSDKNPYLSTSELDKKIMNCVTSNELLNTFHNHSFSIEVPQLISIIFKLAKVIPDTYTEDQFGKYHLRTLKDPRWKDRRMQGLLRYLEESIPKMHGSDKANVLWAVVKLRLPAHKIIDQILKDIFEHDLNTLTPRHISSVAW